MEIKINGSPCQIADPSLSALRQQHKDQHIVTILNGYATTDDLPLHEGDEVFFIPKNSLPPKAALEAMMCARHTPQVHTKVKQGHVAIAGLGGLGSNVAIYLARMGVGSLHLIDFDTVDASNLNRQMYRICDLGKFKADALAEELQEINPFLQIQVDKLRITEENVPSLFTADDIVCEAFDNPDAKTMLIHTLLEKCPDIYIVAASGMAGYGNSNDIITKKITEHFYLCGDQKRAAKPGCGLMAPRVAICAAHEANKIIELLVDKA